MKCWREVLRVRIDTRVRMTSSDVESLLAWASAIDFKPLSICKYLMSENCLENQCAQLDGGEWCSYWPCCSYSLGLLPLPSPPWLLPPTPCVLVEEINLGIMLKTLPHCWFWFQVLRSIRAPNFLQDPKWLHFLFPTLLKGVNIKERININESRKFED